MTKKDYKLNDSPYKGADFIRATVKYSKEYGGYIANYELLEDTGNGLIGKVFCREYYQSGGDGVYMLAMCGRRSAKKEKEAEERFNQVADEYAEKFIYYVCLKLLIPTIKIIKEV